MNNEFADTWFSRCSHAPLSPDLAFIDASMVYGSDAARAAELRTMSNGELKTSANGLNLPYNTNGLPNAGGTGADFFLAGETDVRFQFSLGINPSFFDDSATSQGTLGPTNSWD